MQHFQVNYPTTTLHISDNIDLNSTQHEVILNSTGINISSSQGLKHAFSINDLNGHLVLDSNSITLQENERDAVRIRASDSRIRTSEFYPDSIYDGTSIGSSGQILSSTSYGLAWIDHTGYPNISTVLSVQNGGIAGNADGYSITNLSYVSVITTPEDGISTVGLSISDTNSSLTISPDVISITLGGTSLNISAKVSDSPNQYQLSLPEIAPTAIYINGSTGSSGQVLGYTDTGISWVPASLATVLNISNDAENKSIINISSLGLRQDYNSSSVTISESNGILSISGNSDSSDRYFSGSYMPIVFGETTYYIQLYK